MNVSQRRTTHPDWQLPPGVAHGTWEYCQAAFIATDYDAYLGRHAMFELDMTIIGRHLTEPGVVVDLGCGTGRALLPLVRRGFRGIGVDLSQHMLQVLQQKARRERLPVECVRGNLVELQFLDDQLADYLLCLFSTLGMIRGQEHRRQVLAHARRIARPGGRLILHVHNYWHNAWIRSSRGWLVGNLIGSWLGRATRGDRYYDYRAIRDFYLHAFTARELRSLLTSTGWQIERWYPVNLPADAPEGPARMENSTWRTRLAAQGWILVCRARPARPSPARPLS